MIMRIHGLALFLLLPAGLLIGQIDTITITSTRTVYTQPDQVSLGVAVTSMRPISLDEVVTALQGSGITASNLSGTNGFSWSFTLPVAFSQLPQMLAALGGLKQSVQQKSSGLSLAFGVVGTQNSTASACATPADLLADASQQAQKLANVSGLTLGPVVWLATTAPTPGNIIPVLRLGDFVATGVFTSTTTSNPAYCSLTAKFKIIRSR